MNGPVRATCSRMGTLVCDRHGILLRRDAVRRGLDDNWLARAVAQGLLVKLRHGAYADSGVWDSATRAQRHDLISRAVMQRYDDRVALSHTSLIIRRGGPDWGLDLTSVHVTNLFARGDRTKAGITHHRGVCRVGDITRLDDHWAVVTARAAMETAILAERDPAVCVIDWVLNRGLASYDECAALVDPLMRAWPGSVDLGHVLSLCDSKRESVGETRTALLMGDHGFSEVQPQWEVFRPNGSLAGRVDFTLHRERVMVEFDGKIKYGRLLKPGQTIQDVIMAERSRERLLEELTGYSMFRLVWADLENPRATSERLRQFAARSSRRAS